jgi:hypothetical protein
LRDSEAQAADHVGAGAVGVDVGGQLTAVLAVADVGGCVVAHVLDVDGLQLAELGVQRDTGEKYARQRTLEVVGDEASRALAFPTAPVGIRKMRVGGRCAQPGVEAVVDGGEQAGLGAEVVIQRAGAEPGPAGERAEFQRPSAVYQFVAGRIK